MSSKVWLMICLTLFVSSSATPCRPMLKDASLVLPSYLQNRTSRSKSIIWLVTCKFKLKVIYNIYFFICHYSLMEVNFCHLIQTLQQRRSQFLSWVQWELCRKESLVQRSSERTAGWEWILQTCLWCCTETNKCMRSDVSEQKWVEILKENCCMMSYYTKYETPWITVNMIIKD